MYAPAYKYKKAPGQPGHIAWHDETKQPYHLRYNGKQWEVRPIDGTSRVEEGFTSSDPVKTVDTLDDAWHYAASGGKHLAPERLVLPVPPAAQPHIDAIPPRFHASRTAAADIATSGNGTINTRRVAEGTPEEHLALTATRTIGDRTITVEQRYATHDGTAAKKPPTVTINHGGTITVNEHRLNGEKHMAWYFTADTEDVLTWIGRAEKKVRAS